MYRPSQVSNLAESAAHAAERGLGDALGDVNGPIDEEEVRETPENHL